MPSLLSINMSINNGDVERRYVDLAEFARRQQPDLMIFQEVSIDVGQLALRDLAKSLGGDDSFHYEAAYPGQEDEQGLAVISRMPVRSSRTAQLTSGGNHAQIVEFGDRYERMARAANVHLPADPRKELLRCRNIREVTELIEDGLADDDSTTALYVAGDFNAPPFFPCIRMMKKELGYTSGYEAVHGKEPAATFPTMSTEQLWSGRYITTRQRRLLNCLGSVTGRFRASPTGAASYTTDYIFLKNLPKPTAARLIVAKDNNSAPLSDHCGLQLDINPGVV